MSTLLTILASVILSIGSFLGIQHFQAPTNIALGDFNPTGGGTYRLQSSVGSSDVSLTLTSFKEPVSNIRYTMSYLNSTIEYATLEPQTSTKEFISFTGITQNSDGTATLTGLSRGLGFSYPYTASTTLQQSHSGQSILILSNPPQLTNQYANRNNNDSIFGIWNFASLPTTTQACTTGSQFCNKSYIDAQVSQGSATSTESVIGLSMLDSQASIGLSTASSSNTGPLVIQNKFATTTPGTQCTSGTWNCIVAAASGKISQSWLDLTASFTFSGAVTHTASTTFQTGTTTLNGPVNFGNGPVSGLDWQLVVATTSVNTQKFLQATTSTAYSRYMILINVAGWTNSGDNVSLRFNNDIASDYSYTALADNGAPTSSGSATLILMGRTATSSPGFLTADIMNPASSRKYVTWYGGDFASGPSVPDTFRGAGFWNNTSNQITNFELVGANGSESILGGTKMTIYGSNN